MNPTFKELGRTPYLPCLERMREQVDARARGEVGDEVWLVEHEPVYTRGRRHEDDEILDAATEIVDVERGGQITYHGPGQLVAYPIVELRGTGRDLHRFLRLLEDVVIDTLANWNIEGTRDPRGTGVFVAEKKIASIGIAVRQWVTFHGLALNVTTDLRAFARVRPCGFSPDIMTNLDVELRGRSPALAEVEQAMVEAFRRRFSEYPC